MKKRDPLVEQELVQMTGLLNEWIESRRAVDDALAVDAKGLYLHEPQVRRVNMVLAARAREAHAWGRLRDAIRALHEVGEEAAP